MKVNSCENVALDVLPGTNVNRFNRGLGKGDLRRLVEQFNQTRAGTRTPLDQPIAKITLPTDYEFGDTYVTQDVRVSRSFVFHDRYKLTLIGEAFNIFNIANLSGYGGNMTNAETFGQPTPLRSSVWVRRPEGVPAGSASQLLRRLVSATRNRTLRLMTPKALEMLVVLIERRVH